MFVRLCLQEERYSLRPSCRQRMFLPMFGDSSLIWTVNCFPYWGWRIRIRMIEVSHGADYDAFWPLGSVLLRDPDVLQKSYIHLQDRSKRQSAQPLTPLTLRHWKWRRYVTPKSPSNQEDTLSSSESEVMFSVKRYGCSHGTVCLCDGCYILSFTVMRITTRGHP